MAITTTNPATGETVRTFDALGDRQIAERIAKAADTFSNYRVTTFTQRAEWMRTAAGLLDEQATDIAELMTLEMGKTVKAAKAEVAKCAVAARFYAEHAERFLAD
ncbi:aldehyde dehydrogenase family protein, partial [Actinophytocola sp.]|uniref:aldehyde dehydrogenase family protein n=1 Tax=Actinophytocola sp. TaxID=1872138 RepID=UPI002D7F5A1B